jgi:hypothetical protein
VDGDSEFHVAENLTNDFQMSVAGVRIGADLQCQLPDALAADPDRLLFYEFICAVDNAAGISNRLASDRANQFTRAFHLPPTHKVEHCQLRSAMGPIAAHWQVPEQGLRRVGHGLQVIKSS